MEFIPASHSELMKGRKRCLSCSTIRYIYLNVVELYIRQLRRLLERAVRFAIPYIQCLGFISTLIFPTVIPHRPSKSCHISILLAVTKSRALSSAKDAIGPLEFLTDAEFATLLGDNAGGETSKAGPKNDFNDARAALEDALEDDPDDEAVLPIGLDEIKAMEAASEATEKILDAGLSSKANASLSRHTRSQRPLLTKADMFKLSQGLNSSIIIKWDIKKAEKIRRNDAQGELQVVFQATAAVNTEPVPCLAGRIEEDKTEASIGLVMNPRIISQYNKPS